MKHRAGHNGLGFATFSLRAIYEWDFSDRGSGRAQAFPRFTLWTLSTCESASEELNAD